MIQNLAANDDRALQGDPLILEFQLFISARAFPCVGAKSALNRNRIEFEVCDQLGSDASAQVVRARHEDFSQGHLLPGVEPVSFVVLFRDSAGDEVRFHERRLGLRHGLRAALRRRARRRDRSPFPAGASHGYRELDEQLWFQAARQSQAETTLVVATRASFMGSELDSFVVPGTLLAGFSLTETCRDLLGFTGALCQQ